MLQFSHANRGKRLKMDLTTYIDDLVDVFLAETGTGPNAAWGVDDTVKVDGLGGLWTVAYVFTPASTNVVTKPYVQIVKSVGSRTSLREVHPRRVHLVRKGNAVLEAANRTCA